MTRRQRQFHAWFWAALLTAGCTQPQAEPLPRLGQTIELPENTDLCVSMDDATKLAELKRSGDETAYWGQYIFFAHRNRCGATDGEMIVDRLAEGFACVRRKGKTDCYWMRLPEGRT